MPKLKNGVYPNLKTTIEALPAYTLLSTIVAFEKYGILTGGFTEVV